MERRLLLTLLFAASTVLSAQDPMLYRTYDGHQNNLANEDWGAAHTALLQLAGVGFEDGFSTPAGTDRPNPRLLSNIIFDQPELLPEPMALSDFTWVFGQFIDHDIGLTEGSAEPMNILVPQGDPDFDPLGFGTVNIRMSRNAFMEGTGTNVDNPRQYANGITAFIDGSAVYGSDEERANWLRSFVDGKMKVSSGNLLPYNTTDGEFSSEVDPDAPHMADDVGMASRLFVAGDVRANENPLLLSFHTLFVREHNRRATLIKASNPDWTDEQIFQLARKYVSGLIQAVVYNEWLPAMGINLEDYTGYDETINPQLSNTFTAAAFRVGHTLLNSVIRRVDDTGNELPQGHLPLRFGFFNPTALPEVGGLEPYFAGMGQQVQQTMDSRIVDDVRNFLFGPPGAGGLDLAAININRGRDRGLPTLNAIRQAYGLAPYFFLEQINSDFNVYTQLFQAYFGDINKVDPWIGMLAEARAENELFGPTIIAIMNAQFQSLRDGDRFFYLNDPVLTDEQKQEIHTTSLRDIIMHNTDINLMQDNVFLAMPYEDICSNSTSTVTGNVNVHTTNEAFSNVQMSYSLNGEEVQSQLTAASGAFLFDSTPVCEAAVLNPVYENDIWLNGISIQDIVLLSRHILEINAITDPFQLLAADANNDGNINVNDIIAQRRLILGLSSELPGDLPMWVFIPEDYTFQDPMHPWLENIPDSILLPNPAMMLENQNFIAYKRGDINANATLNNDNLQDEEQLLARSSETGLELVATDIYLERGETADIQLELHPQNKNAANYQFAITASNADFQYAAPAANTANFLHLNERGEIRFCGELDGQIQQFSLRITAQRAGYASEFIKLDEEVLAAFLLENEVSGEFAKIDFDWRSSNANILAVTTFPNPFLSQLTFTVPAPVQSGTASLELYNINGQLVKREIRFLHANATANWTIDTGELAAGQYVYHITSGTDQYKGTATAAAR